jgi:hypothetical protein
MKGGPHAPMDLFVYPTDNQDEREVLSSLDFMVLRNIERVVFALQLPKSKNHPLFDF